MDLTDFAEHVGPTDPVTITGHGTRGGAVPGCRQVSAPSGIERIEPEEMTVSCAAGTAVDELVAALAEHRQTVNLPAGGTVGGALAGGHSDHRQLGYGPIRDILLQMHYVSAAGQVVMAGGPTVKNVSGFDLCRLFVGSRGTLGFLGAVILRTRPLPKASAWFTVAATDPEPLLRSLYKPVSVLWDGTAAHVLLEGHPDDIAAVAAAQAMTTATAPTAPPGSRRVSVASHQLGSLAGPFLAELGTGVVHCVEPPAAAPGAPRLVALQASVKRRFDPTGRLNPGVDVG